MRLAIIIFLLAISVPVFADTHYVRKTGSGSACTQASPCLTIAAGIAAMSGGDTLVVGDGTYTNDPVDGPPSGTSGARTVVQSENIGGAIIQMTNNEKAINVGGNYIDIIGFHAIGNRLGTSDGVVWNTGNYNRYMRLAVEGGVQSGNYSAFVLGTGSQNNLVEECWTWGTSRYMFLVYNEGSGAETINNIFRRNVARHDYSINDEDQEACFTNYDSTNTLFQNNICIDAVSTTYMYGGFWDENNASRDKSGRMYGNIVLNIDGASAGMHDKPSGTRVLEDNIIWASDGGYGTADYLGSGSYPATVTLNRMTIGALTGDYTASWSIAQGVGAKWGVSTRVPTITNSIITGAPDYGIAEWFTNDYIALYNNGANYGGTEHTPTGGANNITNINPLTNCLKYLPRIETANCSLKTAGSNGGQIGATVLYKHGTSGTLYGETGYDTLTSDPLWPFPNEALIKADFASYSGPGPTGARGFATGTSMDGSAQSLTKYIWEYLGNQIPANIYGINVSKLSGGGKISGGTIR